MTEKNLFGEEQDYSFQTKKLSSNESGYQRFKRLNNYRKSEMGGVSCRICKHKQTFDYHGKRYHKCDLIGISNSAATDIRLSYVCNKFGLDKEIF